MAVVIIVSDGIKNNSGIISAIATMLLISLSVPQGESSLFAIQRVIDTFIGTFIAITLNFVIRPPETETAQAITEDLAVLKRKEEKLQIMLVETQKEIERSKNHKH